MALPRRHVLSDHHQRGDDINEHIGYIDDNDHWPNLNDVRAAVNHFAAHDNDPNIHVILANLRAVYDAAAAILDHAATNSAGDRMLGPDDPVRPVPATDNDGELWRLLGDWLVGHNYASDVRDAIAARYGDT